jgi:DNA-binding CsgD family transcriptional regulator
VSGAYLSLIPEFEDMYSISYEMIIDKAVIDPSGKFYFKTAYFPSTDNLYRIHIAKKGDPPASLIIGGKDENHFFLIANKQTQLMVKDTGRAEFIRGIKISGYYPNQQLRQIDEIAGYLDSINYNDSPGKTELIRNSIFEKLRNFADTCSNPLLALYALQKVSLKKDYLQNRSFYEKFLTKWKGERSSYFAEFRNKIPVSNNRTILPITITLIIFTLGFAISFVLLKKYRKNRNVMQDLSVQERRIFGLISEGKSNKEISEILKISLSTVKSHVNNIYSKLDVNSRKEILNLNHNDKG